MEYIGAVVKQPGLELKGEVGASCGRRVSCAGGSRRDVGPWARGAHAVPTRRCDEHREKLGLWIAG